MMFNFYVNQYLFYAMATGKTSILISALDETRQKPERTMGLFFAEP
jgi:maltose alpha-D-glucosyltransferase/alpha-amylase